ncbi:hypothetical protein E1B28_013227 [Marasmius oreades]|uniref:Protein kinase domain-containing protein n=1 Tax=Marasmius oreades TaxID=181124 RepID=A0A9P7RQ44_9AGAR|nr:uncharacterized protein E1B28_013227 [Marasmius oreades]KAG7087246.1 hypothetical protein E1B28_013227 [Marasmius oreades]
MSNCAPGVPWFFPRKRRMSAPPLNFYDLRDMNGKHFWTRQKETEDLFLDPKDMAEYSSFDRLYPTVLFSDDKALKLYSYLVDVSQIVATMELARTKVPVPRVYKHGYSGNCGYILMERIRGYALDNFLRHYKCPIPHKVTSAIKKIVEDLASLGLCHNDVKPRNIVISSTWDVLTLVDWDHCMPLIHAGEYTRRVRWPDKHDPLCIADIWDAFFLSVAADRVGEELLMGQHYRFYMFTVPLRTTGTVSQPFGPQSALSLEYMERRRRSKASDLAGESETAEKAQSVETYSQHVNTDLSIGNCGVTKFVGIYTPEGS